MDTHTINATPRIISWGAIIGGVITVLALSILLSVLGTALGFTMVDPYSDRPVDGVGTAISIWSFVSVLISLAAGGVVAGRLGGAEGASHGFLVWATSLIIAIIISGMLIGGALRAAGNLVGSIASVTGSAVSGMASSMAGSDDDMQNMVNATLGQMGENAGLPPDQTPQNVLAALQQSRVEALRPDYLAKELSATKDDVQSAFSAVMKQPDSLDAEMDRLTDKLKQRTDKISADIKREDVRQALTENTRMSPEEVNQATDSVIENKRQAAAAVKQRLNELEQNVDSARARLLEMKEQAKQKADAAAKVIATSALWSFFALLVGAVVSALCGWWGVKSGCRYQF